MPRFSILVDRLAKPAIRPVQDDTAVPGQLYIVRSRRGEQHLVMCRLKPDGKTRQLGPVPRGFVRDSTIDHIPLGFTISTLRSTPAPCTTAESAIDYVRRHRQKGSFVLDFR